MNYEIPITDLHTKSILLDAWNFEDGRETGGQGIVYKIHAWFIWRSGIGMTKGHNLESTCFNKLHTFSIGDSVNCSTEGGMLE